jgi:hypothetical protein
MHPARLLVLLFFGLALLNARADARLVLDHHGLCCEPIRLETNSVKIWINNEGDESFNGTIHSELYFSTDGILDLEDKLLAQEDRSYFIGRLGGQNTPSLAIQIPDVLPGMYNFIWLLKPDGLPESRFLLPVQVLAPDFQVERFGPVGPAGPGEQVQLDWVIKNTGNGGSVSGNAQRVFYSRDSMLSEDDIFLTGVVNTNGLPKGFSAGFLSKSFQMPNITSRGYFILQIDALNQISELDEGNNVFAFQLPPQEIFISQDGKNVKLSWTRDFGDKRIEMAPIVFPLTWTTLNAARVISNGNYVAEFPKPTNSFVYRLKN